MKQSPCRFVPLALLATVLLFAPGGFADTPPSSPQRVDPKSQSPLNAPPPPPPPSTSMGTDESASLNHGPRAGFMRGSGPVQSELLLGPGSSVRLYFVDESWVDLDLSGSKLEALFLRAGAPEASARPLTCGGRPTPEKPMLFICEMLKDTSLAIGDRLFFKFSKSGLPTKTFNYTFPFRASEGFIEYPSPTAPKKK